MSGICVSPGAVQAPSSKAIPSQRTRRVHHARPDASTPVAAHSVAEFCKAHSLSRAFFYVLRARGDGPDVIKVGRRTLVSAQAASAWRDRMTVDGGSHGR